MQSCGVKNGIFHIIYCTLNPVGVNKRGYRDEFYKSQQVIK